MTINPPIELAAKAIAEADGILVTAGAGMGVDSRLPDFRGNKGFWEAYPALARAGVDFASIANPVAFESYPRRAWGFYGHRLNLYRETLPHAGFRILRILSKKTEHGIFVFTSNVDGQFQKAGYDPKRIVEVHGSIHHLQCQNGCLGDIWSADDFEPRVDEKSCELLSDFPKCPHCGEIARPNILMFSDRHWLDFRTAIQESAMSAWLKKVKRLVVIEIGAGTAVPTVRAKSGIVGGTLIRINPDQPESNYDSTIAIKLGGRKALWDLLETRGNDLVMETISAVQYAESRATLVRWTKRMLDRHPRHIAAAKQWSDKCGITYWEAQAIDWYGLEIEGFTQPKETPPSPSENPEADLKLTAQQILSFYDDYPDVPKNSSLCDCVSMLRKALEQPEPHPELVPAARGLLHFFFDYAGVPANSILRNEIQRLKGLLIQIDPCLGDIHS
jgi:NAD-dependent SIR2 family protein deacetylase